MTEITSPNVGAVAPYADSSAEMHPSGGVTSTGTVDRLTGDLQVIELFNAAAATVDAWDSFVHKTGQVRLAHTIRRLRSAVEALDRA